MIHSYSRNKLIKFGFNAKAERMVAETPRSSLHNITNFQFRYLIPYAFIDLKSKKRIAEKYFFPVLHRTR